jgi:hypothetical protein
MSAEAAAKTAALTQLFNLSRGANVYTFEGALTGDYKVGDQVDVLYNPEKPEEAVIAADNSITTNYGMWFAIGMGIVFIVMGASPFARGLKRLRQQTAPLPG